MYGPSDRAPSLADAGRDRSARRPDGIRLLDRTACWTIRAGRALEFEGQAAGVAATGVELRGMVREGEKMPPENFIEPKPSGVKLCLGLFEPLLRDQHVGKPPANLRIVARKC